MQLKRAGYFSKTHGVKGQLIFRTDFDLDEEHLNVVFVETATGNAPYFISELKVSAGQYVLQLEEVQDVESAKKLIGKSVYLDETVILEDEEDVALEGYEVIDHRYGLLGKVEEVSHTGMQVLLTLHYKGKEVILPLADDLVERIEEGDKKIYFKAPEGLIELYLEEKE